MVVAAAEGNGYDIPPWCVYVYDVSQSKRVVVPTTPPVSFYGGKLAFSLSFGSLIALLFKREREIVDDNHSNKYSKGQQKERGRRRDGQEVEWWEGGGIAFHSSDYLCVNRVQQSFSWLFCSGSNDRHRPGYIRERYL